MMYTDDDLVVWADCLIDYAEDWDSHFKIYGKLFTQEYWYLLVGATRAFWNNKPLNVSSAKSKMRGLLENDDGARDMRITEAIRLGLLIKVRFADLDQKLQDVLGKTDGRMVFLLPTPHLEKAIRLHLASTLSTTVQAIRGIKGSS